MDCKLTSNKFWKFFTKKKRYWKADQALDKYQRRLLQFILIQGSAVNLYADISIYRGINQWKKNYTSRFFSYFDHLQRSIDNKAFHCNYQGSAGKKKTSYPHWQQKKIELIEACVLQIGYVNNFYFFKVMPTSSISRGMCKILHTFYS